MVPALEVNGPTHHPFDGDGMISAIAFRDGRAHFRNRFVRTAAYLEEQRLAKSCIAASLAPKARWLANAFDLRLKNIANTNIIYWGGNF